MKISRWRRGSNLLAWNSEISFYFLRFPGLQKAFASKAQQPNHQDGHPNVWHLQMAILGKHRSHSEVPRIHKEFLSLRCRCFGRINNMGIQQNKKTSSAIPLAPKWPPYRCVRNCKDVLRLNYIKLLCNPPCSLPARRIHNSYSKWHKNSLYMSCLYCLYCYEVAVNLFSCQLHQVASVGFLKRWVNRASTAMSKIWEEKHKQLCMKHLSGEQ